MNLFSLLLDIFKLLLAINFDVNTVENRHPPNLCDIQVFFCSKCGNSSITLNSKRINERPMKLEKPKPETTYNLVGQSVWQTSLADETPYSTATTTFGTPLIHFYRVLHYLHSQFQSIEIDRFMSISMHTFSCR